MLASIQTKAREDDPRFLRTQKALRDAIISLVTHDPSGAISIKLLCETAGVTRPTFYQHFSDIADALHKTALARIAEIYPISRPETPFTTTQDRMALMMPALQHLHEHRVFYLRVIESAASPAFFEQLVRFVRARIVLTEDQSDQLIGKARIGDIADILAGGSMWLVVQWLRGAETGTPEDIAERIASLALLILPSTSS